MNTRWRVLLDDGSNNEGGGGGSAASDQPTTIAQDPLMESLLADLKEIIPNDLVIEAAKETPEETKPSAETPKEGEKPKDPEKPADAPLKAGVKKREDPAKVAARVVDERLKNLPTPPLPEKKEEKKVEEPQNLNDDQKGELQDAEFAEKEDEKFKGFKDKLLKFYKDADDYVEKHKADSDRTFDENDSEFVAWVKKNKPSWNGRREDFRIGRIAEARAQKIVAEREKETKAKVDEANRNAIEAKVAPKIKESVQAIITEFDAETKTDDSLEAEVFEEVKGLVADASTLYLSLIHGTQRFDPTNENHAWISKFVIDAGEDMAKKPAAETVRSGKKFVTPGKFIDMQKANDPKIGDVWTFDQTDVLKLIKDRGVSSAKKKIQAEVEKAEKRGFVRQKPSPVPKQEQPVKAVTGPKATTAPSPGPAEGSEIKQTDHPGLDVIETLGLKPK